MSVRSSWGPEARRVVNLWGRQWSRGELLAPGEPRHYELELGALSGAADVEAFRARNQELAAGAIT